MTLIHGPVSSVTNISSPLKIFKSTCRFTTLQKAKPNQESSVEKYPFPQSKSIAIAIFHPCFDTIVNILHY